MRCARLHTIAVIIFLSGAAASAQTPESPHDLWEHMIAAKGGHERLQSVRTFAWMATRVTPSHRNWSEGPSMVYVAAPPDHLWIYESGYAETWRGRGLSSPRMGIPATLTSLEAWQLACFLETSVVRPTPVSVEPSAEDARVVILEATSGHLKVRYIVDRESYIVRQVTLSRRTDDPESGFSRFIDERPFTLEGTETVGGIQMPRWIRTGDYVRDSQISDQSRARRSAVRTVARPSGPLGCVGRVPVGRPSSGQEARRPPARTTTAEAGLPGWGRLRRHIARVRARRSHRCGRRLDKQKNSPSCGLRGSHRRSGRRSCDGRCDGATTCFFAAAGGRSLGWRDRDLDVRRAARDIPAFDVRRRASGHSPFFRQGRSRRRRPRARRRAERATRCRLQMVRRISGADRLVSAGAYRVSM